MSPARKKHIRPKLPDIDNINTTVCKDLLRRKLGFPRTLTSPHQIDVDVETMTTALQSSIKDSTLHSTTAPLRTKAPWWNHDLYRLRQKLRAARKRLRERADLEDHVLENRLKAQYQREIRKAKATSWKTFCNEELNEDPFKALKKITGKLRGANISELRTTDGQQTLSEPIILATLATKFFPRVSPSSNPETGRVEQAARAALAHGNSAHPPLTLSELDHAVNSMKRNKAPGQDSLKTEHIQLFYTELKPHLLNIFEACLKLSYFPRKWKVAQVLTLPKPNKEDYTDPSAYRPISLLPVLGKSRENYTR